MIDIKTFEKAYDKGYVKGYVKGYSDGYDDGYISALEQLKKDIDSSIEIINDLKDDE